MFCKPGSALSISASVHTFTACVRRMVARRGSSARKLAALRFISMCGVCLEPAVENWIGTSVDATSLL